MKLETLYLQESLLGRILLIYHGLHLLQGSINFDAIFTKILLNASAISVKSSIRVSPTFSEVTLDYLCFALPALIFLSVT